VVLLPRTLDEGDFVRAWKYEKPTKDKDFVYGYIATVGEGGTFTLGGSSEVYVGAEACDPDKLRSVIG
jgi:hypothetical protein